MLQTIEGLLIIGAFAGVITRFVVGTREIGCWSLVWVPIAMVVYIAWWQQAHPENLRSTSGLDFIFGPLWPTIAAIAGYFLTSTVLSLLRREDPER